MLILSINTGPLIRVNFGMHSSQMSSKASMSVFDLNPPRLAKACQTNLTGKWEHGCCINKWWCYNDGRGPPFASRFFFPPSLSMTRSIQKPCFTSIVAGKHATLKALKACKDNSKLSDREGKTWHDQYNYLQTLYIYICTEDIRRSLPRITPAVASAMKGLERFWAPKTGTSWYFHTVACLGSTLYHFCLDRRTWSDVQSEAVSEDLELHRRSCAGIFAVQCKR